MAHLRAITHNIFKGYSLSSLNYKEFLALAPSSHYSLSGLTSLEDLNVAQNKLDCIPECLHNLPALCRGLVGLSPLGAAE